VVMDSKEEPRARRYPSRRSARRRNGLTAHLPSCKGSNSTGRAGRAHLSA
jgi:hypothetical protein